MNAQKLWKGSDYAMGYKPRGSTTYPINAKRVKVMDIIKQPIPGGQKERTIVKVMVLNDDGMPPDIQNPIRKEVVARDIIDHWDEYLETVGYDEREEWLEREADRERKREEARIEREAQNATYWIGHFLRGIGRKIEEEERQAIFEKKQKRLTRVRNVLITRGFKPDQFEVIDNGYGRTYINIEIEEMERWLGFEKSE